MSTLTPVQLAAWIADVEPIVRSRLRAVDYWQTRPAKKRRATVNDVKRALAADLEMFYAHLIEGKPNLPRRWPG